MSRLQRCKWCDEELELREWEQLQDNCMVKVGIYKYYACSICGYRYHKGEVDNEKT